MTVFASDNNLALIFNWACSAAVRLISKRTLLSPRKKSIIPASCTKCSDSPTVSTGVPLRFASAVEVNFIRHSYKQDLTALNLLRLPEVQHPDRPPVDHLSAQADVQRAAERIPLLPRNT